MVRKMLIVRGVSSTDDLEQLGLDMARRYSDADIVVFAGADGRGMVAKGAKETMLVEYIDAFPSLGRVATVMHRVKEAYSNTATPIIGWDDETAVGMFLYYWPIALDSVSTVMDAIEAGDIESVERAADSFIASDFGMNLDALATLAADAQHDDAAGRAADRATS